MQTSNLWYASQFPEALYLPRNAPEYSVRVTRGHFLASESTVWICGLARDLGSNIVNTIARIEKLGKYFKDYHVCIYENDSTDKTLSMLNQWASNNDRVHILSESLGREYHGPTTTIERRKDMASYRNKYMGFIEDTPTNFVIVMDLDLPGGFSYHGLFHSLSYCYPAISSNGILYQNKQRLFYDSWAFRKLGREEKHDDNYINPLVFYRGDPIIEVYSGFGGMCLYQYDAIIEHRYDESDCDHVTLHKKMRNAGHRIFMNPSQIALYSETQYTC